MKKLNKILMIGGLGLLAFSSCTLDEVGDLNGPTIENIIESSTRGDIQDLVGGVLNDMRIRLGTYYDDVGVIGREYYRFSSSDPRFTSDLLGKGAATLDNNTFYTTGPWGARYGTVKSANVILQAIPNTTPTYSAQELSAIQGFAKTIQAYELMLNLNLMYQNGIRVDVSDPQNLGPFLGYTESLGAISTLLDDAATDLSAGGSAFPFNMTDGFVDFNTPTTFREFNRGLAARVAMYEGDSAGVLSALGESFFDLAGDLNKGVYYEYSSNGGDLFNPMFFPENASTAGVRIVQPSFITDAETNDARVPNKTFLRDAPLTLDDLTGSYDVFRYETNVSSIPMIRNEELILLYAEANMVSNPGDAETAINVVRNAAGLGDVAPGSVDEDRIVYERRYSLYAEGHRWVDMRRFDRLSELPIDRVDDDVWVQFPIPATENQ